MMVLYYFATARISQRAMLSVKTEIGDWLSIGFNANRTEELLLFESIFIN